MTCGVCGGSLADVPYESTEEIDRDQIAGVRAEETKEREIVRRAEKRNIALTISEFILVVGCLVGGVVLIGQFHSVYGLLLIFVGIGILWVLATPYPCRLPSIWGRV
jgi:hypothetical protein